MEEELKKRVSTAGIMVGIVLLTAALALWNPAFNWIFLSLGFIAVAFAAFEYASIQRVPESSTGTKVIYFVGLFLPQLGSVATLASIDLYSAQQHIELGLLIPLFLTFCSFFIGILSLVIDGRKSLDLAAAFARDYFIGLFLVGLCGSLLIELAVLPGAPRHIIWLLLIVCVNDSAAYFVGKSIGGPKLAPNISPGKTISGAIGGLLGGMIIGAVFYRLIPQIPDVKFALFFAFVIVICAQLGDLGKSFYKRVHGVKDTGSILPGHGGILDRIDGLLAAAPVLYLFAYVML
ncbi:MAG: phosphatidate cytidylyltransferase [Bdellovibrionota bacterium]